MKTRTSRYALCALSLLAAGSAQAFTTAVGEPDSLETFMFADDFERATSGAFDDLAAGNAANAAVASATAGAGATIGASLDFERIKVNGRTVETTSIPLSYTMRSDIDPRRQTVVSTRLFNSRTSGVDTVGAVVGLAFRRPVNDQWTLVPAVSYGYVDFSNGDATGGSYAASLASVYRIRVDRYEIALANQIGHYRTLEYRGAAIGKFRPDINNTVARNGIVVSIPTVLADRKLSTEVSYTRTDTLTGHRATNVDYYNEIGVTLGNNRRLANGRSFVRGGLTYVDGQGDVHGLRAKIGYWF